MAFFATTRGEPAARPQRRVYDGPLTSLSADHPLNVPSHVPSGIDLAVGNRRVPPGPAPTGFAGHASSRSTSVRAVLTGGEAEPPTNSGPRGPRHEYQAPNYAVSRSQDGGAAKDLLYGGPSPQPSAPMGTGPSPPPTGHPLAGAYEILTEFVPQLPRDADGNIDEASMKMALGHVGLQLSLDGFAELLARCDVSPTGFPPFSDFILCCTRPDRAVAAEPTASGAPPSSGGGGITDYTAAGAPPAPPAAPPASHTDDEAQTAPQPSAAPSYQPRVSLNEAKEIMAMAPAPPEQRADRTWRGMQVEASVARKQSQTVAPLPPGPSGPARGNFPLGMRTENVMPLGTNVAPMYANTIKGRGHASSQKFTNSFNPDFFLL